MIWQDVDLGQDGGFGGAFNQLRRTCHSHLEIPIGAIRFIAGNDVHDGQMPGFKEADEPVDILDYCLQVVPALRLLKKELLHVDNGKR
jgi:hypothetical protein